MVLYKINRQDLINRQNMIRNEHIKRHYKDLSRLNRMLSKGIISRCEYEDMMLNTNMEYKIYLEVISSDDLPF